MPLRTRDICRASLEFASSERLLKAYRKSGRYSPPPKFRSKHAVDDEIKMVAWYSTCEGPLYEDPGSWGKAFRFISAFTKQSSNPFGRRRWELPRLYGPIPNVAPTDVLNQLHSAFMRNGLHELDRNELSFNAVFTSSESCQVMDLPEPYGKWYQSRRQPRWKQDVELEIDIQCQVFSEDVNGQPGAFASFVDVEVTSLAAPLFIQLGADLARLLHLDGVTGSKSRDNLQRTLAASMRTEIDAL